VEVTGVVAGGDHRPGVPGSVHGHDLDRVQMVHDQAVTAAQQPPAASGDMAARTHRVAHAAGDGHPPAAEQTVVDVAEIGARLDREGVLVLVEVHAVHLRHVDDHIDVGVVDELLVAVAAAADGHASALRRRPGDDVDHLLGGEHQVHAVRRRGPALVQAGREVRVAGIPGLDHGRGGGRDLRRGTAGRCQGRRGEAECGGAGRPACGGEDGTAGGLFSVG
jgi:hypothetical protein